MGNSGSSGKTAGSASASESVPGLHGVMNRSYTRLGTIAVTGRFHQLPRKLEDDYIIDRGVVLGTGYSGSVLLATRRTTGARLAVKSFKILGASAEKREELETECEVFLAMDHPHVADLVDVYQSEDALHLVMECLEGGELFERVMEQRKFSERTSSQITWQMLLAVKYLHERHIVHRDLKLENFVYERKDTDHLKLIDFGFSKIWDCNTKMALSCGTLAYVAPEVLDHSYTSQVDLWSLGVIVFILLVGYMPFSGNESETVQSIRKGRYRIQREKWVRVSPDAQEFVSLLLKVSPAERLTAELALQHRWVARHDQAQPDVSGATVDALCSFAKASKFRRACMSMMAWSLTSEERAQVRDAFIAMDKSRSGSIKLWELKQVLLEHFDVSGTDVEPIFAALDTSSDGEIHYAEFLAAMCTSRIVLHDDLLRATFRRFDCDGSGEITLENLRVVLGESCTGDQIDSMLEEADLKKDGKISYEEFIAFVQNGSMPDQQEEIVSHIIDVELNKLDDAAQGSRRDSLPQMHRWELMRRNSSSVRTVETANAVAKASPFAPPERVSSLVQQSSLGRSSRSMKCVQCGQQ